MFGLKINWGRKKSPKEEPSKDKYRKTGETYLRNPKLKSAGVKVEFTAKQLKEYVKCKDDPIYFAKKYIKIIDVDEGIVPFDMWEFQERFVKQIIKHRFNIAKWPRQTGKALALDTPILTNTGWKNIKEVHIGDYVYDDSGKLTQVINESEIFQNHDCYEIKFDNGEVIIADAEHLWTVANSDWKKKNDGFKTLTTKELSKILLQKKKNGSSIRIKINEAIKFENKNLLIDPYVLGVWLGDGNSCDARFGVSLNDVDHFREKISKSYTLSEKRIYDERNFCQQNITGLHIQLKQINVLKNKHIPDEYKFSSIDQRLELIRGLMDTDGYCSKKGSCEFYQKSKLTVTHSEFKYLIFRSLSQTHSTVTATLS